MIEFGDMAKAQVTQGLMVAVLEYAGYRVTKLGVEERLNEIKRLDFDGYAQLNLPKQLRTIPDLLVTEPDLSAAHLVEIKFRRQISDPGAAELMRLLSEQFEYWPSAVAVLFLGESYWDGRGYIQDHVRVIRQSDLSKLSDTAHDLRWRIESLPMVQSVFQRLRGSTYHDHADRISKIVRELAAM